MRRRLGQGAAKAEINQHALLRTIIGEYVDALKETASPDGVPVIEEPVMEEPAATQDSLVFAEASQPEDAAAPEEPEAPAVEPSAACDVDDDDSQLVFAEASQPAETEAE